MGRAPFNRPVSREIETGYLEAKLAETRPPNPIQLLFKHILVCGIRFLSRSHQVSMPKEIRDGWNLYSGQRSSSGEIEWVVAFRLEITQFTIFNGDGKFFVILFIVRKIRILHSAVFLLFRFTELSINCPDFYPFNFWIFKRFIKGAIRK